LYYEDDYDYLDEAVDDRRERRLLTEYSSDEDDDAISYLRTNFQHEQHSILDQQRTEKELVARAMSALALAEETNSPDVQMDEDEWMAWSRHLAREEAKLKRKQEALAAARTRTMASASISAPNLAPTPKYPTKDHSSSSSNLPYPSSSRPESRSTSSLRNYMDTPPLTPPTLTTASNSSRKKASSKPHPADKTYYPRDYAASTVSSSSRHRSDREREERRSERERAERRPRRRRDDSD